MEITCLGCFSRSNGRAWYPLVNGSGPPPPGLDTSTTRMTDAPPSEDAIKIGDCILVQYEGAQQKSLKYVAQLIDIQDGEFHVIHYHKSDERGTLFVAKDVTDKYGWVEEKQIVRKLPAPVMDNRERYHFAMPIQEAN